MVENNRVCRMEMKNVFCDAKMGITIITETGQWTEEEIDMLRSCVHRFALDLNKLSQDIKNRTVSQICTTLKKKESEDVMMKMSLVRPENSLVSTQAMNQFMQPPAQVSALTPMKVVSTRSVLGKNEVVQVGNTELKEI